MTLATSPNFEDSKNEELDQHASVVEAGSLTANRGGDTTAEDGNAYNDIEDAKLLRKVDKK